LKGEREDKGEGTWAPLLICMRYFGYKVFDGKPRGNDGASFIFIYYFQFLRDRERGGGGNDRFFFVVGSICNYNILFLKK
jgi:hypothetical protein